MKAIGLGVVSFAHGHAGIYCRAMRDTPGVDLVAGWDNDSTRGQQITAECGMEYCNKVDDLFADERIHAVIVSTETNRHADFVERAAEAGKDILLQKPMATTLKDCDRIIAAIKKHGVKFSMAFQMRHDPANQKIGELLAENAIGRIGMMRRRHSIPLLLNPNFVNGPTRWHIDPEANVGMFFDDAAHPADWLYSLFGMPVSVSAEIDAVLTHDSPDDNGVAIFRFARGEMVVLLNSSTTLSAVNTTEIYGDEGTIIHDYGDSPSTSAPRPNDAVALRLLRKGDSQWTTYPIPIPDSHAERIGAVPFAFIDYLRGDDSLAISAEEGRASVEMILGAYQSAKEGRRIHFPLQP